VLVVIQTVRLSRATTAYRQLLRGTPAGVSLPDVLSAHIGRVQDVSRRLGDG